MITVKITKYDEFTRAESVVLEDTRARFDDNLPHQSGQYFGGSWDLGGRVRKHRRQEVHPDSTIYNIKYVTYFVTQTYTGSWEQFNAEYYPERVSRA